MEKQYRVRTKDGRMIYGVLNSIGSKNLLIFVHGITGHKNEHIFYNGAKFFAKNGFDTFRFDLYSNEKGGRLMRDCDLDIHASDTDRIVDFFHRRYNKIFLAGHSYGGATILKCDTKKVHGLILWDPSVKYRVKEMLTNVKTLGKVKTLNWGVEFIIANKMLDEWKNFPEPKDLMNKINIPVKIICAGNSAMKSKRKSYYNVAKQPKYMSIIKGAGHNFDEQNTEQDLFTETLKFIRKYSK